MNIKLKGVNTLNKIVEVNTKLKTNLDLIKLTRNEVGTFLSCYSPLKSAIPVDKLAKFHHKEFVNIDTE